MDSKIKIEFDQPNGVYFSGQILSGKVEVSLSEPKTVQGIFLKIHGFGKTEWSKGKEKKRSGHPDYTGFEEYLLLNTCLLEPSNEGPLELPIGMQTFSFKHQLPNTLPSSYEGMFGHVRYQAKVLIEYPGKFNQRHEAGFMVYKTIDLDRDCPQSRLPIEIENLKSFGCGFCKTEPVILKATLSQTGFLPGQIVPVKIHISSKSIEVIEIRLYLRKLITYRAERPMVAFKEECVELLHKTSGHLQSGSSSVFEEKLLLPSVPPTTLLYSKIIQINYDVKIEAVLTATRDALTVLCPLTVGSTTSLLNNSDLAMNAIQEFAMQNSNVDQGSQGQLTVEMVPPMYDTDCSCEHEGQKEKQPLSL